MTKPLYSKLPALLLTLIVGLMATSTAFGAATIVIQNNDPAGVGFNDGTPVIPVGGNNGTTRGEQRLNAFKLAANIWGATLTSGPTITVAATWEPLPCTATSAALATAGNFGSIHSGFPNAPFPGTWYGSALANALSGTDLDSDPEIRARININLGNPGCLTGTRFYLGLDNVHGTNVDLVTVLIHELAHGLGFQTYTNTTTGVLAGSDIGQGRPSIYDRFLLDNSTGKTWPQMTNAERVASAINTNNLVWNGPQVKSDAAIPGLLIGGKDSAGRPLMHAPNPLQGGSSVSHWSESANPDQLMESSISGGLSHEVTPPDDLTFSLLRDIGWCSGGCAPPPAPANNNFANAQVISGCSGSVNGTNLGSNKETGEPSHEPDNDPGGGSVWYQWQAPSTGSVTMTTAGSTYDTLLAVYTGNGVSALAAIVKNDDVDANVRTSAVTFNAMSGTVYKIAVDGWGGDTGNILLNWNLSGCTPPKTDQTINFPPPADKTFGDAPFTVSATATSGLAVSFIIVSGSPATATISGNTITITGVGLVTVRASQAGNANFNAAAFVDRTLTVAKASQTITFNTLANKTFGDGPFNISATSSSSLQVSFSIVGPATMSGNTINITGAGPVTVTASQPGNANFNAATSIPRTFTVAKANQAITFDAPANKIFGDAPFNASASSSSGLPINFSIVSGPATISGNTISISGLGEVTVRASQAGDANYNAASVDRSFTVEAGSFQPVVLIVDQIEIKTWTFQGRTYAYLKLSFPNAGYRVANWGQPVRAGNDFAADALVEKFTGASVQALTTTAQIYDLGVVADGNYTFTFKNSGTVVKSQPFTVSSATPPPNLIDTAREFVKQQYRDFLNREADQAGEDFWTDNITLCSDPARRPAGQTEAQCTLRQRETTSGAFFLSPESQYTAYYVYRMYVGALGRKPKLSEFTPDAQFVGAGIVVNGQLSGAKINENKAAFAQQFVNCTDAAKYRCAEFKAIYDGLNNTQYVDKLFETTGVTASASDKAALVNGLNANPASETRASVLAKVVDGINVISEGNQQFMTTYGEAFYNSQFSEAFVQLEYFGYMKRDPDDGGQAFWLGKLNQFGGNFVNAEMVLAFISSPEYRARFGPP